MKSNLQLMLEAIKDLTKQLEATPASNKGEGVTSITAGVYKSKEGGRHAHARATVKMHFTGFANEEPEVSKAVASQRNIGM